jgi:hypothetical protein
MFNTKNLVLKETDVPSYWVFQYYLNLSEPLTGQNIKIKSIFNPNDKTPSFCMYVDKSAGVYKFKDFSTGKNGNKIDLVKLMFDLEYRDAVRKVVEDYNSYVKTTDLQEVFFKVQEKWKIDFVNPRQWTENDGRYWLNFRIGSNLLKEYNVKPIEYYNLIKEEEGEVRKLKIEGHSIYGYFDKNNELYKIYQPLSKHKFHNVKSYLQGFDQLTYTKPYLVICSSLKDALCLKSIGYNIEVLAPESENTIIKSHIIEHLKRKYKKIITFFDNDTAGNLAIEKYKTSYNLDGLTLPLSKDISDSMREHGFDVVHGILKPLFKEILNK